MINEQIEQYVLDTDINFDNIYNEKDKITNYNFNYGVLTSDLTFSTANLFASLAKENGIMLLGEKSGGGACAILLSYTPENILYSISSPKHIVNNNGESIDSGIEVDANLVQTTDEGKDYSKYYDLDTLSTLLNEFYKEKEITIKDIDNTLKAKIANTKEELKKIIELTKEEENALQSGKDLFIFIETNDINDTISSEDKQLIEDILDDNYKIGKYLDINLFKQIYGKEKIKITELNDKIKIHLEIPNDLIKENRTFSIIRIHNETVTKITPEIDGNNLTFETDKFSTYALVYTDSVKDTDTVENPDTIDNIDFYFKVLIVNLLGSISLIIYYKKKELN